MSRPRRCSAHLPFTDGFLYRFAHGENVGLGPAPRKTKVRLFREREVSRFSPYGMGLSPPRSGMARAVLLRPPWAVQDRSVGGAHHGERFFRNSH